MIDGAMAEHRIELGLLFRRAGIVTGVFEAFALNGALRVSVEYCGRFNAEQVVDSRHDVDSMNVLVSHFTSCWNPPWPRDEAHVCSPPFIACKALPVWEGRIEGPRPARIVVVIGRWASQFVNTLYVLFDRVRNIVKEFDFIYGTVRTALTARSVVGGDDDDRVVKLTRLLEVIEQATNMVIGIRYKPRIHLSHANKHPTLCLLYTSDAADEEDSVDLGGRRIIKKKKHQNNQKTNQ